MKINSPFESPVGKSAPDISAEEAVRGPSVGSIQNGSTSYPIQNTVPNPPGSPSISRVPEKLPFD